MFEEFARSVAHRAAAPVPYTEKTREKSSQVAEGRESAGVRHSRQNGLPAALTTVKEK